MRIFGWKIEWDYLRYFTDILLGTESWNAMMNGWINAAAISGEIGNFGNYYGRNDKSIAISQIISSLCLARAPTAIIHNYILLIWKRELLVCWSDRGLHKRWYIECLFSWENYRQDLIMLSMSLKINNNKIQKLLSKLSIQQESARSSHKNLSVILRAPINIYGIRSQHARLILLWLSSQYTILYKNYLLDIKSA